MRHEHVNIDVQLVGYTVTNKTKYNKWTIIETTRGKFVAKAMTGLPFE